MGDGSPSSPRTRDVETRPLKSSRKVGSQRMLVEREYELVSVDVGNTILQLQGSGVASRLLARCTGLREREALRTRLLTRALDESTLRSVAADLGLSHDVIVDDAPEARFFEGASDALAQLCRRHVVVTFSNTSSVEAGSSDPISRDFPAIARYRSCDLGFAKPDCRAFERVLESEGSRADRTVHIGDSWECDVLGATAAGWGAIWISAKKQPPSSPDGLLTAVSSLQAAADFLTNGVAA